MLNKKMLVQTLLFCSVIIVGCVAPQEQEQTMKIKNAKKQGESEASCPADTHQHFIGELYQNVRSQLPEHRWKRPDYMYTQGYISDRLNVVTDAKGIIVAIKCG